MIDTVRLKSSYIGELDVKQIAKSCCLRSCTDLGTGEVLYEFTSGELLGSYDSRVMLRIERTDWARGGTGKKVAKENTPPYLMVEASVHKAMETVRARREVFRRLNACCDGQLARALCNTWNTLATDGEAFAKEQMSQRTYYRHRAMLQRLGISWRRITDMKGIDSTIIPHGFAPVRSDPRRMTEQAPEVAAKIAEFIPQCYGKQYA